MIKKLQELNPLLNVKKGEKWNRGYLITYNVSYAYNGSEPCIMPKIIIPDNYILHDIAIGLDLNSYPPRATSLLIKKGL